MKTGHRAAAFGVLCLLGAGAATYAADWPNWRGPDHDGFSQETGLVSSWSPAGENLIWKVDFVGRSTPVVLHGQVCVMGRAGEGVARQEAVACYDAGTGAKRWEHRFDVYLTTVAFSRVGWASLAGDPETGNVYAHGVAGQLIAYDPDGKILWSRSLTEESGRVSGYGGRTQTPIIDGDALILSFVNAGWGEQAAPRHRISAFDKRTGEMLWVATPGEMPYDMNTQSNPIAATIDGRRLVVAGNGDGQVYALDAATGSKVWGFKLSRKGLNSTVVVAGDTVFASHGEENLDEPTMGRVVAFRGTGGGDITGQELWRVNELTGGFPSPAYHEGKLYVVDNSANLYRIDAATGRVDWHHGLGTVGKASPVFADGKIYVPELNGRFYILRPKPDGVEVLDDDELKVGDRPAEIYGSPAVAYGRVYLSTEAGLYCIGDRKKPFRAEGSPRVAKLPAGQGEPRQLAIVPAEVALEPGAKSTFLARIYDAKGLPLGAATGASWKLEGLQGRIEGEGELSVSADPRPQAGKIVVTAGGLTASARVRVLPGLPWSEDFESYPVDGVPPHWLGAKVKFKVAEREGQKVLVKPALASGLLRSSTFIGRSASDYTIEADVMGGQAGRRKTDVGLIASGYMLQLMGNHQRLELISWEAEERVAAKVSFPWEAGVWYRLKLRAELDRGRGLVRGKAWRRDAAEPEAWTVALDDPVPVSSGSPGLTGYSPADILFDNIKVTVNHP